MCMVYKVCGICERCLLSSVGETISLLFIRENLISTVRSKVYMVKTKVKLFLNRKYDLCSCLSQSEQSYLWRQSLCTRGHAMKTDPWYLFVTFYQIIFKVWLWKMVVWQILSWEVYSCILFQRATQWSRIFSNMADILTRVMHLYNTWGLTCYWRICYNEWCQYSNQSKAFMHGWFNLLLGNS